MTIAPPFVMKLLRPAGAAARMCPAITLILFSLFFSGDVVPEDQYCDENPGDDDRVHYRLVMIFMKTTVRTAEMTRSLTSGDIPSRVCSMMISLRRTG
jgi:hypothetical protein